jgi:hypothetical protein
MRSAQFWPRILFVLLTGSIAYVAAHNDRVTKGISPDARHDHLD